MSSSSAMLLHPAPNVSSTAAQLQFIQHSMRHAAGTFLALQVCLVKPIIFRLIVCVRGNTSCSDFNFVTDMLIRSNS